MLGGVQVFLTAPFKAGKSFSSSLRNKLKDSSTNTQRPAAHGPSPTHTTAHGEQRSGGSHQSPRTGSPTSAHRNQDDGSPPSDPVPPIIHLNSGESEEEFTLEVLIDNFVGALFAFGFFGGIAYCGLLVQVKDRRFALIETMLNRRPLTKAERDLRAASARRIAQMERQYAAESSPLLKGLSRRRKRYVLGAK